MNAYAIFAVNEHLEYLIEDAARNRVPEASRPEPPPADRQRGRKRSPQLRHGEVRVELDPPEARRLPVPGLSLLPPPRPSSLIARQTSASSGGGLRVSGVRRGPAGRIDVAEGPRRPGRSAAPDSASGIDHGVESRLRRASAAALPGRSSSRRRSASRAGRPGGPPSGAAARRPPTRARPRRHAGVLERATSRREHRRHHRRHVAADDEHDVGVASRPRPAAQTGERPLEGASRRGRARTPAGSVGTASGRDDDDDLVGDAAGPPRWRARASADRRSARPACRARTALDRPPARTIAATRTAVTADPAGAGALGPGTWPSAVRRRIPRRSRSSRIAMTYLRLVPVASR